MLAAIVCGWGRGEANIDQPKANDTRHERTLTAWRGNDILPTDVLANMGRIAVLVALRSMIDKKIIAP